MSTTQQANLLDLANLLVGPRPSPATDAAQQLLLVAAAAKAATPLPTNTATTTTTSHSLPARRVSAPDPPGDSCASPVVHLLVNERKRSLVPSSPTPMTTDDDDDDNLTAVTASPVAKKARRERSWDEMFGALVSYKARNESTDVPVNYPDDPELGLWVHQQRRRKFLLGTEERYKLDLISFEWDCIPSTTKTATATYATTTAKAASALISPDVDVKVVPKLASLAFRLPSTTALPKATTKEVKTVTTYKPTSRNIFDALDEYKQRHRPSSPSTPPASPPRQVPAHIQEKISAKLSAAIATLSTTAAVTAAAAGTGVVSEAQKHWNTMFAKLQAHKTRHGHCNVQLSNPEDPALGLWVLKQRSKYQQGTIPKAHKALLDALGFERDGLIGAAATAAAAADAAAAAATRTRLPHAPRGGMVTPDMVGSITPSSTTDKVSGPGDASTKERKRVRTFEENFNALLEYKKVHGNVDVPQKYEKDRKLGIWVKNVRQHPQRHTEEQRARLDGIGFKWRKLQLDQQWNDAFKQLLEYKEKYGDCNVPSRWKQCPALARWVHTQRTMYRRDKLLKGRKTKLEEVGFVWDCNALRDDEAFQENLERLKEYKEKMGHSNIPNKYRRDRPLGRWAAKMRDLHLVNDLDEHRKKALEEVGFVWEAPAEESGGSESDTAEAEYI